LSGANTIPMYLDRFQKRDYLSLMRYLATVKKAEARSVKTKRGTKGVVPRKAQHFDGMDAAFRAAWKKRHRVFVLKEASESSNPWVPKLEVSAGLPEGSFRKFLSRYPHKDVKYQGKVYFSELKRPPVGAPSTPR
jgi:hypothetical protein